MFAAQVAVPEGAVGRGDGRDEKRTRKLINND
jgi:hypothetical protein